MGAFPFITELAEGQSTQLSTPEGRWFNATGVSVGTVTAGAVNDFVFQPGGTAHDNVYTSWPALMAAVNAANGIRRILIDTTFGTATVPAGTWAVDNVQLYGKTTAAGFIASLGFADGAHLTFATLYVSLLILNSSSTSSVATIASGKGAFVLFASAALFSASAPFFHVASGAATFTLGLVEGSEIGDATNSVLQVDSEIGANLVVLDQAIVFANATSGAGGLTVPVSPGGEVDSPQLAGISIFFLGVANQVLYTAATVADWSGTNPTSVANALDRIAAKITPIP